MASAPTASTRSAVYGLPEPLVVPVGGDRRRCETLLELEAALAEQVRAALAEAPPEPPDAAAAAELRRAYQRVGELLSSLIAEPGRGHEVMAGLADGSVVPEPAWRELFATLSRCAPGAYEPRLLGLAKYRRYLMLRLQELRPEAVPSLDPTGVSAPARDLPAHAARLGLARLRRGRVETLATDGAAPTGFALWLADREFRVEPAAGPSLVDDEGRRAALREGPNLVGRALYNDVVVHASYASVSRRHLVIGVSGGRVATLRDLSAHGSYVDPARLRRDGRPTGP